MPRALTFAASALSPDTTSTGTLPVARSWPMTVNPSGPGIARSSRTRSGRSSRNRLTAVSPSYAVMTWWPSVPTSAVIAPTIAGSSSTTRIRSGLVPITRSLPPSSNSSSPSRGHRRRPREHEPPAAPLGRPAPQASPHRPREPAGGVQADARTAGGRRLVARVGLEDPLPPLGRDPGALVGDGNPHDALDQ